MNKVLVNYAINSGINLDDLNTILDGCRSKNNEVHVKLFVFSDENTVGEHIAQANDEDIATITVLDHSADDPSEFTSMVRANIIEYMAHQSVVNMQENIILNTYALDDINFSLFKEEKECGAIYSDYDVSINNSGRLRTFLSSPPIKKQMPMPCVFFNTEKVVSFLGQESPELHTFQQSMVIHIPKSLYVAYTK
jgi:hypothetical protein